MPDAPPNPFTPGTPAFLVCVDDQPSTILVKDAAGKDQRIDNFARWRERGANALYRSQKDEPLSQWAGRAVAAGLNMIPTVPFLPDGSVDVPTLRAVDGLDGVLGWTFEDEADRRSAIRPNPPITFARMQAIAAQVRAVTNKPIYLTFTGGGGGFDNAYYQGDAAGQASIGGPGHRAPAGWFGLCDVVVWDYHLWASGRPGLWDIHDRMQDRAHDWSGGKPQLIYVESSPQNLENKGRPGPNAAQYAEIIQRRVDRARAKGQNLKGIVIFPQRIGGGFQFDATPDDVAAVMPDVHRALTGAAPAPLPADPAVAALTQRLAAVEADNAALKATVTDLTQTIARIRQAVAPATTQPVQ